MCRDGWHIVQFRSLIAAYELIRNGYEDVRVHKSGIQGWSQEGRCGTFCTSLSDYDIKAWQETPMCSNSVYILNCAHLLLGTCCKMLFGYGKW